MMGQQHKCEQSTANMKQKDRETLQLELFTRDVGLGKLF